MCLHSCHDPYPTLSSHPQGANLPSLSRAIVACGWFGIQTWIGGSSIYQMLMAVTGGAIASAALPVLGISLPEFVCFMVFWAAQVRANVGGVLPARDCMDRRKHRESRLPVNLVWRSVACCTTCWLPTLAVSHATHGAPLPYIAAQQRRGVDQDTSEIRPGLSRRAGVDRGPRHGVHPHPGEVLCAHPDRAVAGAHGVGGHHGGRLRAHAVHALAVRGGHAQGACVGAWDMVGQQGHASGRTETVRCGMSASAL